MIIRQFMPSDLDEIRSLFCQTIQEINCRDYSPEQIKIWSLGAHDRDAWQARLSDRWVTVAEEAGIILGFTAMELDGHIDLLYCHSQYQRQGIASQLLHHLELQVRSLSLQRIYTEASITARPFFERRGFQVIESQWVERQGITFLRFLMEKRLTDQDLR